MTTIAIVTGSESALTILQALRQADIIVQSKSTLQDLMSEHPELFQDIEMELMDANQLSEGDIRDIILRLHDDAVSVLDLEVAKLEEQRAEAEEMLEMLLGYPNSLEHILLTPDRYTYGCPDVYEVSLKDSISTHPTCAGPADMHSTMQAQPRLSHRAQFPFVPSRHGNR
ncbi:MAG: hypothetical protein VX730_09600 [Pseudomonadota bacterium]|nr:hypothetical protein [Pseudomonadota bacterium]